MKNNAIENKFRWIYLAVIFIILVLPVLSWPPYFAPPDFTKSIIFRSITAILLFLFLWQFLYRKNEISLPGIRRNPNGKPGASNGAGRIIWAMAALFFVYLLASIFSVDPYFSLWGSPYRGGGFITLAFYFIFAGLAFTILKKQDWQRAWDFSIVVGILVSLVAIIQYWGLFNRIFMPVPGRPPSTMGNPILLAIYFLLLFFITICFLIQKKGLPYKLFYGFSAVLFLYVILITGSRSAYLGLAIGGLYFFLFFPKKIKAVKIAVIVLLILTAGIVFYANSTSQYPKFLEQNRLFNSVMPRLSMNILIEDPRFAAWPIEWNILKSRPLLGYGPENFSVGFDRYYDPAIPYLDRDVPWWDRAHDIIIQTGSDAGILGIMAYLLLFGVLFWQLRKAKHAENNADINAEKTLMAQGVQATLIAYLIANLFSFDSFGTYIIFFFIIGYSLHLIHEAEHKSTQNGTQNNTKSGWKSAAVFVLFFILIIFLWQYNILPFQINAEINKASDLAERNQCDQAFGLMDKTLPSRTFLDSYARMEYVEFEKTCGDYHPENALIYAKKGLELISEAVKIQPLYTRYWLSLGQMATILAEKEKDAATKSNLITQANYYFDKALQLSPKHQEILTGKAKIKILAGDYENAQNYSEECIAINTRMGSCYWYLALSQIYMKDTADADKNMQSASRQGYNYNINSVASLGEIADAYEHISDYKNLAITFEKLVAISPDVAQYHSSLAFFYSKIGEYKKAREQAMIVLKLSPESKPNVDAFLKTLP